MINPDKTYKLGEVIKNKLLPGVNSYSSLYNLITVPSGNSRVLRTDPERLKATVIKKPWNKIGTYFIKGEDLLDFIRRNSPSC